MFDSAALSYQTGLNGYFGLFALAGDPHWRQCRDPEGNLVEHASAAAAEADAAHRLTAALAALQAPRRPTLRIRCCNGNRDSWLLARLRPDGSEIESHGGWTTGCSIDNLLARAGHLQPGPDDVVELLFTPT